MIKQAAVCLIMAVVLTMTACEKQTAENSGDLFDISFITNAFDVFPPAKGTALEAIKEKFGANITAQFIPSADYKGKLSVIMASGNYPDVITLESIDSNFYKWVRQGAFLPIDALIDSYATLRAVPDYIWGRMKVDGHIYGIPIYAPTYRLSVLIRQDWLDNLGLGMPTNYDELLKTAIAFTNNDPDKNGKADTFGFNLGGPINPDFNLGAYWASGWYHKDNEGNYMPGWIGPGRKQLIQVLHGAYAQGAVTKNFAAATNWQQTNKDFYSGKSGIFVGTPSGMNEESVQSLLKAVPAARLAPIPYFVAPDGRQGGLNGPGYYGLTVLSSKLGQEPDKLRKILEIMDYGRMFIPMSERTPANERFDWLFGRAGIGYEMIDGAPIPKPGSESVTPYQYMLQRHEYWKPWAPGNEANEFAKTYKSSEMRRLAKSIEEMEKQSNKDPYDDPSQGIYSEALAQKGEELNKFLIGEQTKMIVGQRPVEEWDQMIEEWKQRGGARIMKEVNDGIQARLRNK
jgi:putative aldouronate transport system substrate-binding protein